MEKYYTEEWLTNIVRESLQQSYEDAVAVPFSDDHEDILKCLKRVIQYYSTEGQFKDWCENNGFEELSNDDRLRRRIIDTWNQTAMQENDINMMEDRTFIATASSPGNIWQRNVVIHAASIAKAQDKFFDWLKTQSVYEHMWKLNLDIYEGEHDSVVEIL
jgi:hypothetical protein